MHSGKDIRSKMLEQLVMDCERFGFNEKDSLSYIESRTGGKGIDRSSYYEIKKSLSNNELRNCRENGISYEGRICP